MEPQINYTLLTSLVGVVVGLVKVLEIVITFLIKKLQNGKEYDYKKKLDEVYRLTLDLHSWHDKTDDSGKFIWYVSPEILKYEHELLGQMKEYIFVQRELLKGFDKVVDVINQIDKRQEIIANKVCIVGDCSRRSPP